MTAESGVSLTATPLTGSILVSRLIFFDMRRLIKFLKFPNKILLFKTLYQYFYVSIFFRAHNYQKLIPQHIGNKQIRSKKKIDRELAWQVITVFKNNFPRLQNCLFSATIFYRSFKAYFPDLRLVVGVNNLEEFKAHAWLQDSQGVWLEDENVVSFDTIWTSE